MRPLCGPSTDDTTPGREKTGRCYLPVLATLLCACRFVSANVPHNSAPGHVAMRVTKGVIYYSAVAQLEGERMSSDEPGNSDSDG